MTAAVVGAALVLVLTVAGCAKQEAPAPKAAAPAAAPATAADAEPIKDGPDQLTTDQNHDPSTMPAALAWTLT